MSALRLNLEAVGVVNSEEVMFDKASLTVSSDNAASLRSFIESEYESFFEQVDFEFGENTYERVFTLDEISDDEAEITIC